jgi:hypothetical protein
MLKYFSFAILFTLWGSFAFAQSPYGRVLTLDNNGTQQWIDIGVLLSTYPTYHPGSPLPIWLTSGNSLTGSEKLGSTNNQPVVVITNNQETFRFNPPGASAPAWSIQRGGGNQRGLHAVDLQSVRWAATQVASGDYSVIGGGLYNTASGSVSPLAGGISNTASGVCHRWRGRAQHRQRLCCHR